MADKRAEQTIIEGSRTPAPTGPSNVRKRRDRGNPDNALDRRSARWHHQLPPRGAALRHLDRGRGQDPGGKPGEITHGLIYQPLTDESFWAEKGRGASLQDRRLRVSARRNLDEALIGTGVPHFGRGNVADWSRIFGAIAPEVCGLRASARQRSISPGSRRVGSTASGKTISTFGTPPRAFLLVKEAGGFVADYRGPDRMFERREYLAASGELHSKLHKLLAGCLFA